MAIDREPMGKTPDQPVPPTSPNPGDPGLARDLQAGLAQPENAPHGAKETWLGLDATGWVAAAMVILILIMLWQGVPRLIARSLDGRIAKIRADLDEAARLRAEAETLLAEAEAKRRQANADADAILNAARHEAGVLADEARAGLDALVARRTRTAEDKIAAAERAAEADIRARAADLAAQAARRLIADGADPALRQRLTDGAISELDRRLH